MKTKGIYFLYRILQAFGSPILILYLLLRGCRDRAYWRSLTQRLGWLPASYIQTSPGAIWLHAVSVGEVIASVELLRRLRLEFPASPLFVSTSTTAGHTLASGKLREFVHGVFYVPLDYCFAVRRVLRALQPSLVIVAETEIWPNLFRETKRTGAALVLVNGRISDRAFPRYRRLSWFFAYPLAHLDLVLAQSDEIARRFVAIGAPAARVHLGGNLKYDFEAREAPPNSPVRAFLQAVHPTSIWVAASTMPPSLPGDPDEDDAVIDAFRALAPRHPRLLLILVPRKPERFPVAAAKLAAAAIPFVRRTGLPASLELPGVLLLDTVGELSGIFPLADVVFMGGTLASRGGHNILEPAFFARPIVTGPHMENFQAIADEFHFAHASVDIPSAGALSTAIDDLLTHPAHAAEIGRRALTCAAANRGATSLAVTSLRRLYDGHIPRRRPAWPWFPLAWALAKVWGWGGRRRLRHGVLGRRRLFVPVVSVGNITMGGTGKTPCVLALARALAARGRRPGIVTRGYGRNSPHNCIVAAPAESARVEHTGDEPLIFIRAGVAPVGIGSSRYDAGKLLECRFDIDLALLDDGFSHVRLTRQLDILLIDALNPFAGGAMFPLGRLREPVPGLARADVFIVTRSDISALTQAVQQTIRRWNQRAPIFRARMRPVAWVEQRTGCRLELGDLSPAGLAAAFCGLGNPQAFRQTLASLGIVPVEWVEFEDHHRYRPRELRRLGNLFRIAGANAVLTTEKDAVNLCDGAAELLGPLPLYWLQVEMVIEGEAELIDTILARV